MQKSKKQSAIPKQKDILLILNHLLQKGYSIKLSNRLQSLIRLLQVQKDIIYNKYKHLLADNNQSTASDEEDTTHDE